MIHNSNYYNSNNLNTDTFYHLKLIILFIRENWLLLTITKLKPFVYRYNNTYIIIDIHCKYIIFINNILISLYTLLIINNDNDFFSAE